MRHSFRSWILAVSLAFGISSPALAQAVSAIAILNGGDVSPRSVLTGAVGFGDFTIDLGKSELSYDITLVALATRITGGHIHVGSPGVSGPIIFDLRPSSQSGDVNPRGTLTRADIKTAADLGIRTIEDALKSLAFLGGYVDFHTERNGEGEIRGQIIPIDLADASALRIKLLRSRRNRGERTE